MIQLNNIDKCDINFNIGGKKINIKSDWKQIFIRLKTC